MATHVVHTTLPAEYTADSLSHNCLEGADSAERSLTACSIQLYPGNAALQKYAATIYDKTNTDSGTLKIETKKEDEEIVQKFKEDIESSHPIKHYQNKHFKGYECSRLVLKSNVIIKNLQLYGIGSHKSLTLQFPNNIKQSQFINAFIRGYFDGDGSLCLYKNGIFDIKILGTKKFLEDIKSIVGIQCRISNPKSNIYELRISKNSERKKFLTFIYKDATIYLKRKYDRYNLFMQKH